MSRTATKKFVQPREAASGDYQGETFVLNPNEVFGAEHELVRAYPHLFRPVKESRPVVEQMTDAPGELRGE